MQNQQPPNTSRPGMPCPQTDSNSPYSTAPRSSPLASAAQAALNERLHRATRQGDAHAISALLEQGADVGSESADDPEVAGFSPLEVAALKGNEEVCRLLLSRGADPNQDQHLPLAIAASEGHEAVCRLLLAQGAAINAEMGPGFSALICAVERGRTLVARLLLEQGANPNASREFLPDTFSPSVHSPSVHSPGTHSPGILTSGNLPAGMEKTMSCLMIAAFSGHTDICRLLLGSGAVLEARGPYGLTPLAFAASSGRKEACHVLLAAGADPNTADAAGDTPLLSAASEGHTDICELMLESGAAINVRNSAGDDAVAIGLARKDTDLLTLLVMHQPDFADLEAILEGRLPNAEPNTFPPNTSSANTSSATTSSPPGSSFAFCSRCGSSLPDGSGTPGGASFCPTCGHALPAPSAPVSSYGSSSYGASASGSAPRVSPFPPRASSPLSGGLSSGNYSHVFVQFEAAGAKEGKSAKWVPTFNWSAFLLGPVWYLLKGMWVKALLFTVVSLLLVGVTGGLSALAAWLYYGLFGNWDLYLWEKHEKQGW